jgi:hypothetical protein
MLQFFARSEVFMAVKFQVELFWVVTPSSVVVGCGRIPTFQRYVLPPSSDKVGGSMDPLKRWFPTTTLHGITTHKASTLLLRHVWTWVRHTLAVTPIHISADLFGTLSFISVCFWSWKELVPWFLQYRNYSASVWTTLKVTAQFLL